MRDEPGIQKEYIFLSLSSFLLSKMAIKERRRKLFLFIPRPSRVRGTARQHRSACQAGEAQLLIPSRRVMRRVQVRRFRGG